MRYIWLDLGLLDPAVVPKFPELTAVTIVDFIPLPFDGDAAARYGTLVALVLVANRDPKPRRMDLMIAAIASSRGLPLYTRNADDFRGLGCMVEVVAV
ncbi:type II toxin-antitoxin system VapC family toxin [Amycolatopsis sp. CB00013]|uniref:type II toxin-antitoxin system VapC family toxin n=1 Tax=Amycolatopsis sp. CB00013 TaxID=1703945 RepID=UPI000A579732|nr:type II toxin-antitoxin system VapC family toxin [Amycolatopsis sp. CB00013]